MNQGIKGGIWCKTFAAGVEQLNEIKNNYIKKGIQPFEERIGKHDACIIFENEDYWKVIRASDNSRGNKLNISYIEYGIDKEIIDCIIRPCTCIYPFQAFNYFISEDIL